MQKWKKEIEFYLQMKKNVIVLEGNIYDKYLFEGVLFNLKEYIIQGILVEGNRTEESDIYIYDVLNGFRDVKGSEVSIDDLGKKYNIKNIRRVPNQPEVVVASRIIKEVLSKKREVTDDNTEYVMEDKDSIKDIFIVDYSSRICLASSNVSQDEREVFMNLLDGCINMREDKKIIFLVDKIEDFPEWFVKNNILLKNIVIPKPDKEARKEYISIHSDIGENKKIDIIKKTEGMYLEDIEAIVECCKREEEKLSVQDVIFAYKYGIKENPWKDINLKEVQKTLYARVKGQDKVIDGVMKVLKNAVLGFSGSQHSSAGMPKGILFFAGATGTGKTETAKAIAEGIFGDETQYIRFDMSEYREQNSDQKLFGAPPDYVGYEAGGQLTNAMKEKPFSVLLFDEVDKASPTIMDKFLQILEDGRMTDGRGNTVSFSETIIIFTSNEGIYKKNRHENGERIPTIPNGIVKSIEHEKIILEELKKSFRPELFARIGEDNCLVFHNIDENAAIEILMNKNFKNFEETYKYILLDDSFKNNIKNMLHENWKEVCTENGRGVGRFFEKNVSKKISSSIFDCLNKDKKIMDDVEKVLVKENEVHIVYKKGI